MHSTAHSLYLQSAIAHEVRRLYKLATYSSQQETSPVYLGLNLVQQALQVLPHVCQHVRSDWREGTPACGNKAALLRAHHPSAFQAAGP